jgi:hypothetical protein
MGRLELGRRVVPGGETIALIESLGGTQAERLHAR